MPTSLKSLLSIVLIGLAVGCAKIPSSGVEKSGIAKRELVAIGLVKDGLGLATAGRLYEAEASIRQAQYLFPKAENIELNLAIILERQGRYEEAAKILREMLKRKPDSPGYLKALARVLYASGRSKEAISIYRDLFERGIQSDHGLAADAATSLSLIHFARGEEQEALCYSQNILFLRNDPGALSRHLRLLNGLGRSEMVVHLLNLIANDARMRQDPWILTQVAAARIGVGDLAGATDIVKSLKVTVPEDPDLKLAIDVMSSLLKLKDEGEQPEASLTDLRIQDAVSLSRLALYWPARIEEYSFTELLAAQPEESSDGSKPAVSWLERQLDELRTLVTR